MLSDAAKYYGCPVVELEWRKDKFGAFHVRKKGSNNGKEMQGHGKENEVSNVEVKGDEAEKN